MKYPSHHQVTVSAELNPPISLCSLCQHIGHLVQVVSFFADLHADLHAEVVGAFQISTGISREDAMALSRLYAVQLLGNCCRDFAAAATWLESGGAGLSHEQQEVRRKQQ